MKEQKKRPSATTIRLEDLDREAIAAIKHYYGVTSDSDTIKLALRETYRSIQLQAHPPNQPER